MIGKLLKAGLQSGTIMGIADMCTQVFVEGKHVTMSRTINPVTANGNILGGQDVDSYDEVRTLRWALMGFVLHGPYFLAGFSFIDRRIVGTGAAAVAKKTAAAQFFLFPPYLVALFGVLGVLEHNPDIPAKIQTRVPEAFLSGCLYWPFANSINFKLVPNNLRVPYVALSAGIWNSYLSYTNNEKRDSKNDKNNDVLDGQ